MVRVNVDNVDVSTGRAVKYSAEVIEKIQGFKTPYFVRTMYNAMVFNGHSQGGYYMELPAPFVKKHGDKFQTSVTLEGPTGEVWKVRLRIQLSSVQARVSFAAGWREFSQAHQLERGDLLLFSVVAESKFIVYIFSQAGKLVQRRHTHPLRHRKKFPSRTLKLSDDDDSNPSESDSAPTPPSPKRKAKASRLPGRSKKTESNLKSRAKRKGNDTKLTTGPKKKRRGKQLYSETEVFKLMEEVARGEGKVSHVINGRLVAWEKVEDDSTCSADLDSQTVRETPRQSGPREPSPRINQVPDFAEENAPATSASTSWPTWLQLFGLNEQEQSHQTWQESEHSGTFE